MQGVLGIAERGGRVVAGRIDEVSRESVNPYINKFIPWGSAISTDEHAAYRYLCGIAYEHGVVRHKRKEWKKGIHPYEHDRRLLEPSKEQHQGHACSCERQTSVEVRRRVLLPLQHAEGAAAIFDRLLAGLVLPFAKAQKNPLDVEGSEQGSVDSGPASGASSCDSSGASSSWSKGIRSKLFSSIIRVRRQNLSDRRCSKLRGYSAHRVCHLSCLSLVV